MNVTKSAAYVKSEGSIISEIGSVISYNTKYENEISFQYYL